MSLVNTLCRELSVQVQKPTAILRLVFQGARLIEHEYAEGACTETGNKISGMVDERIESRPVDIEALGNWLRSVAVAHPAVEVFLNGQLLSGSAQGAA